MKDVLVVIGGIIPDADLPASEGDGRLGRFPAWHGHAGNRRFHQNPASAPTSGRC